MKPKEIKQKEVKLCSSSCYGNNDSKYKVKRYDVKVNKDYMDATKNL